MCSAGVRVFLELGGWRAERISGRLLRRCLDPVAAERSWELGKDPVWPDGFCDAQQNEEMSADQVHLERDSQP